MGKLVSRVPLAVFRGQEQKEDGEFYTGQATGLRHRYTRQGEMHPQPATGSGVTQTHANPLLKNHSSRHCFSSLLIDGALR